MLEDLIPPEQIKALAGAATFQRGEGYFREGRVEIMVDEPDRLTGMVEGCEAEPYRVRMETTGDELIWDCTCPVGDRGEFCKHLVALALARLASGDESPLPNLDALQAAHPAQAGATNRKRRGKEEEIRAFLESQDQTRLVGWLLEAARGDRATRERLLLAARAGGPVSEFRKLITDVTRVRDFLDYQEMSGFARRVHGMIDALEGLRGAELMGLTEYAVECLHKALETCDDSDGHMGDLLGRLVALHTRASVEAKPDPAAFARWLFDRQMEDAWDTWPGPEAYIEVLRKAGMVEYARLAWNEWDKVPARVPGGLDRGADHYRITGIMESLARMGGDPEARVEVRKKDLSTPYAFLCIAEIYRDARRYDEALDWAERGLAAFPKNPDWRLQDCLVDEYFRRERKADAMDIAWRQFTGQDGGVEGYKKLMTRAKRADEVVAWRARALDHLREVAVRQHAQFKPLFGQRPARPDLTTLVQALLWDKDLGAALIEARAGSCKPRTLVDLARALAATQPEVAISLYKRAIHPIVEVKKNDAYAEAANIVRAVRDMLAGLGRATEFGDWLAEVRLAHKPKRNFMKLLDGL
jgi:uncharacterized Zn finger protein